MGGLLAVFPYRLTPVNLKNVAEKETPKNTSAAPAPGAPADAHGDEPAGPSKAQIAAEKAKKALSSLKNLKNLGALANTKELVADLFDPDQRTRKMARYFVASVVGIVVVLTLSGIYISKMRLEKNLAAITDTGEQGKNFADFIKRQADEAKRKFSQQSLGTFTIELKIPDEKNRKRPPGVMDLAEVEVVIECDEKETCEFIEERMAVVRNEMTGIFTPMDREELMSREGKRKLQLRIQGKLNTWLPKGKIEHIYFNKLIIS